jgi:hypothetical protein
VKEIPTNRRIVLPERIEVDCAACAAKTYHTVLTAIPRDRVSSDQLITWYDDYEIIRCSGCGEVSFRHIFVSDDGGFVTEDGELVPDEKVKLYPPRISGIKRVEGWEYLPYPVREVFNEAFNALEYRLPLLAALGMRAVIEAVCVNKGLSNANSKVPLERMLRNMKENGLITESQMERLMVLKADGNEAAHRFRFVSIDQLKVAMKEVMHLLYDQFIGPAEFGLTKPTS